MGGQLAKTLEQIRDGLGVAYGCQTHGHLLHWERAALDVTVIDWGVGEGEGGQSVVIEDSIVV